MNLKTTLVTVMAALGGALSSVAVEAADTDPLPQFLSGTRLFMPGSTTDVRPGVMQFSPQYPLWSDGTTKRRWIELPPGTFIDASRPAAWEFPPGTRLWKEFSFGRRVETRLIERLADGSWRYATYVWNEEQSDALLAPSQGFPSLPISDAPNGRYTVPSESDCRACHEGASPVLGFSALQLSPDRDPLAPHATSSAATAIDLRTLIAAGWLRNLPLALIEKPPRIAASSPSERAALGYLHGNCGHCHSNRDSSDASVPVSLMLAQDVSDPGSADKVRRSLLGVSGRFRLPGTQLATPLVAPGDSHASVLTVRMRSRDARVQMPPLGTAIADSEGLALIERWIDHDLLEPKELPSTHRY